MIASDPEIPDGRKLSAHEEAQAICVTRGTLKGYIKSGRIHTNPDGTIAVAELRQASFVLLQ